MVWFHSCTKNNWKEITVNEGVKTITYGIGQVFQVHANN